MIWYPLGALSKRKTKNKSKTKARRSGARSSAKDLVAKTTRRRNKLIRKLFSLGKKPRCFVTLLYPGKIAHTRSAKEIKHDLDRLATRIRASCPNSWFIYSIEWKKRAGFHFHLHGCSKRVKCFFRDFIRGAWQRIVEAVSPKLVKVEYNRTDKESDQRSSYMVRRDKFEDKMHVVEHLEGAYDFGVINFKNIPIAKRVIKDFSIDEFKEIREQMDDEYVALCSDEDLPMNTRHLEKLRQADAYFNILKPGSRVAEFLSTL